MQMIKKLCDLTFCFVLNSKWKLDLRESRRSFSKLMSAAEDCKHVLSTLNTAHCFVESLHEGVDLSTNVSRARIDMLVTPLLSSFIEPIQEALKQSGLDPQEIHKVRFTFNVALAEFLTSFSNFRL